MGYDPEENGDGILEGFDESEEIEDDELVPIVDDEGVERLCVVLAVAEVEGRDYALLAPAEQLSDEEGEELELFLFTYEVDDDGTEVFGGIDDEDTYLKVRDFFSTLLGEEMQSEDA